MKIQYICQVEIASGKGHWHSWTPEIQLVIQHEALFGAIVAALAEEMSLHAIVTSTFG